VPWALLNSALANQKVYVYFVFLIQVPTTKDQQLLQTPVSLVTQKKSPKVF
jgi:hypothetical protein